MRKPRPVDAALAVLGAALPPNLDPALRRAALRDTRAAVSATTPWDAEALDAAVLAKYEGIVAAFPDPAQDEAAWRRAVERAWPGALGLPSTVQEMIERTRAAGLALGMTKAAVADGCHTLRGRPLKPDDYGAVARWCAELATVQSPEDWTRFVTSAWGRARTESVRAQGVAARRSCGRTRSGPGGGVVRRCHSHSHAHADCGPRQADIARERARAHAWAWQTGGVPLVRLGLTLPRMPGWSAIEALDAMDPLVAGVVEALAERLGCRLAARIGVERQKDDFPEWSILLVDVDGTLQQRMTTEAAEYQAAQQFNPPSMGPEMLANLALLGSNWEMSAQLWPQLQADVEAVAQAAGFGRVYLAPVAKLLGTWADLHKSSAQSAGHEWPTGFKRWRSTRGNAKGSVLAFSAAGEAGGGMATAKAEAAAQKRADAGAMRDALDPSVSTRAETAADEAEREVEAARQSAEAAEAAAREAAATADTKRREAASAAAIAAAAERDAIAAGRAIRAADREAKAALRRAQDALARIERAGQRRDPAVERAQTYARACARAADRAEAKVAKARSHVGALKIPSAIAKAERHLAKIKAAARKARAAANTAANTVQAEERSRAEAKAAAGARIEAEAAASLGLALRARLAAIQLRETAIVAARRAEAATRTAGRASDVADNLALDAMIEADRVGPLERRARRLRQIVADRPNPAEVARRRAESMALLDGLRAAGPPLPGERRGLSWWCVPSLPRERCACERACSCDGEALAPRRWTLTDEVRWLRQEAPWLTIHGDIGCDGWIRRYSIVGGRPRNDAERAKAAQNDAARRRLGAAIDALFAPPASASAPPSAAANTPVTPPPRRSPTGGRIITIPAGVVLREDPARRLAAVEVRLRRDRRLPADRPLGLPLDLAPYADPSWSPLPVELDDAAIVEVLRRYAIAATRRAAVAPGAVDSAGFPAANEAEWLAAAEALELSA